MMTNMAAILHIASSSRDMRQEAGLKYDLSESVTVASHEDPDL